MSKTILTGYSDSLSGACGIGLFADFEKVELRKNSWYKPTPLKDEKNHGGSGWAISGFIDNEDCREAYDTLKEKYGILYQSPVRMNANSGNEFFFCLYDSTPKAREY
jgi:hypothetical protein